MAPPSVRGKGPTSEMYDEIVEIIVGIGKRKKTFKVHKGVVCHYSGYFDKALNGDFKEGKTGKIMLPEEQVGLFQRLVHWLYSGEIEYGDLAENGWDCMLSRLWVLADRRDIPLLMNMCIDALLDRIAQKWKIPNDVVMNRVYENTMEGSLLRTFLIHVIGKIANPSVVSKGKYNAEILKDLLMVVWEMEPSKDRVLRENVAEMDTCPFHRHEEGVSCSKEKA